MAKTRLQAMKCQQITISETLEETLFLTSRIDLPCLHSIHTIQYTTALFHCCVICIVPHVTKPTSQSHVTIHCLTRD